MDIDVKEIDIKNLAYIGDAIYELHIREHIVEKFKENVNKSHKRAIKYVSAKAQAKITNEILEELTDDERDIVRRGRNASTNTVPKNTDVVTYKIATGFESLIGYLYLTKETDRLEYIIKRGIILIEGE